MFYWSSYGSQETQEFELIAIAFFISIDKKICLSKIPSPNANAYGITENKDECNSLVDNNGINLNVDKYLKQTQRCL